MTRSRGERRRRKSQIKAGLIQGALERNNRYAGTYWRGGSDTPVSRWQELPKEGYSRIGRVLRNEGKDRVRVYRCGSRFCALCVGNLTYQHVRQQATMDADYAAWLAETYGSVCGWDTNADWEADTCQRLVGEVIAVLDALVFAREEP